MTGRVSRVRALLTPTSQRIRTARQRLRTPQDQPDDAGRGPEPGAATGERDTLWQPVGVSQAIPAPVRLAAAWALRLIVIGAAIYLTLLVLYELTVVVVPAVVSILVAALLAPAVTRLRRWGVPRRLAPVLAFLGGLLAFGGLITLIVRELVVNFQTVVDTVQQGLIQVTRWLSGPPFHLDTDALDKAVGNAVNSLKDDPNQVVSGTVDIVTTAGGLITGIVLVLFTTYFFVTDGAAVWRWTVRLFPRRARAQVDRAGQHAWDVLVAYVRVTLLISALCGLAVGIAAAIAGVPLALSAGLVVFLFGFIPTLGGVISSIVVILLTLVSTGIGTTLAMAIVVVAVQTLQGNVLYPVLMNRQLKVHPVASLLLVVVGTVLGGIFGALIAVPVAAVVNTMWTELARAAHGRPPDPGPTLVGPDPEHDRPPDPADAMAVADPPAGEQPAGGAITAPGEPDPSS